jgi:hypothetical protein
MVTALSASRLWNIIVRTAHIGVTGILLGGHFFRVPRGALLPFLYVAILSGAGLAILEVYPEWRGLFEVRSLVIAAKLVLLCLIPLLWDYRACILLVIVAMSSAGSHLPRRFRHYSVLEHQQAKAMRDNRTAA